MVEHTINSVIQRRGIIRKLKMRQIELSIMRLRDIRQSKILEINKRGNDKILKRFLK